MDLMLNWLVVGIGDITRKRVLPAILNGTRSKLTGIVTRDPAKAAPYGVRAWTSLEDALEESDAEAVYVATPVFLHAPQTIASLRAGRHVLCEKPMAMNYAEACSMERAAKDAGKLLGIAYYRRMYPKISRTVELLKAGAIGAPVLAEASSHDWFFPVDQERNWFIDPRRAGGGPLYDIASHRIDLMNYLFGQPARASGHISTLIHPMDVEDNATVLIDYANGVRGVVDVRWHSRTPRDEFRIRGTEGEINLTPLNGPSLVYPGGEESIPPHGNLHYPCIENFVGAVLDGAPLRSSAETARWTDWVTEQIMAAQEGLTSHDK
ncbi:MAG: Gfo/Idh/MocA family oxidoreductase [Bryobacteraceae bacterium]|nr:Gfo/Idh/MocA family oxidoreductase [Bryobacteraceae bacterium]